MKNLFTKICWNNIFNIALIAGIVTLSILGKDGWGWLMFLLFIQKS